MTNIAQRITIIFIAVLFFAFASALSIFVIYDAVQSNKKDDTANSNQTAQTDTQNTKKLANFTPVKNVPELKTTDTKVGDGAAITSADQTITVEYSGAVAATGVIFDSSEGKAPLTSQLSGLITGWQKGMIGMKVGGERRMLIPADQAYGANPPQGSGIPANAPLVFDVTLKDVK